MPTFFPIAAETTQEMHETVKRHSFWYRAQSVLMVAAGIIALVFPAASSIAFVRFLGWLLIFGGAVQAISLVGTCHVSHFWLQLISVALFLIVGSLLPVIRRKV